MLIRSRADNSIYALVLPFTTESGWNAVKVKTADKPYKGEHGIGALFNYHSSKWEVVTQKDMSAWLTGYTALGEWFAKGKPMIDLH